MKEDNTGFFFQSGDYGEFIPLLRVRHHWEKKAEENDSRQPDTEENSSGHASIFPDVVEDQD
jgi:hypothetical protein